MLYLLLCIISSTAIILVFKQFQRWNIDNFDAIVVNYFVAATLGLMHGWEHLDVPAIGRGEMPWIRIALILGLLFISLFNVIGLTTQKVSITAAAVANNMSMVIPVIAAVFLFGEHMSWPKVTGIVLAIASIYFATQRQAVRQGNRKYFYLPVLLFFGSGIILTLIKFAEEYYLPEGQSTVFTSAIFLVAGSIGLLIMVANAVRKKKIPRWKSLWGGFLLGFPNYGSIYFLVKTLELDVLDSSAVFPINNMSVVVLSAVFARLIFRERLSFVNWVGILLSVLAIVLISFHNRFVPL